LDVSLIKDCSNHRYIQAREVSCFHYLKRVGNGKLKAEI
jgi:hypothetical protein